MNQYFRTFVHTATLMLGMILSCGQEATTDLNFLPVIIFDLNGVCFHTVKSAAMKLLSTTTAIWYSLRHGFQNPKHSFYRILNLIEEPSEQYHGHHRPHDDDGNPLPELMCQWLDGSKSTNDIKKQIYAATARHPEWFVSHVEKKMVLDLVNMIFDPQSPLAIQHLSPMAFELVKACKNSGYNVYVLSNWDKESFVHFQKKHEEFFALFDGIVISGEAEVAKPHADIYTYFLRKFNLNPAQCIFVDDQQINLDAAEKHGFTVILCPKKRSGIKKYPDLEYVWKQIRARTDEASYTKYSEESAAISI